MALIVISAIAVASTVGMIALWFLTVGRELRRKRDTAQSAQSQYTAFRSGGCRGVPCTEDAKAVLSRSRDIYAQAVTHYNQALHTPKNRMPAILMGFRSMKMEP